MPKARTTQKVDWNQDVLSCFERKSIVFTGLSKWVRQRVSHESNFRQSMQSLRTFVDHMMNSDLDTPGMSDTSGMNETTRSTRYDK